MVKKIRFWDDICNTKIPKNQNFEKNSLLKMCSAKPVSAKKTFFGQQIKSVTWHYGNLYSINYTITVIAYNSLRVIVATDDMRGVTDFT